MPLLRPTEANDYYKGEGVSVREIHGDYGQYIMGIDSDGDEISASKVYWYFEPLQQTCEEGVPVHDPVNNPSHYQLLPGVEVRDVIKVLVSKIADKGVLTEMQISDYVQMMQYLLRFMEKGGVEDIKKAKVYLEWILEDA